MKHIWLAILLLSFIGCMKARSEMSPIDVRLEVAASLIDQGQIDQAMSILAALNQEGVKNTTLWYLQGKALWKKQVYEEAEALLKKAHEKDKKNADILHVLGLLYADQSRWQESEWMLQEALKCDPSDARIANNLGFIQLGQKKYTEAEALFRKAVQLDGTERQYRNNLGLALIAQGREKEALQMFQTANPPADALTMVGYALEIQGDFDGARTYYTQALVLNDRLQAAQNGLSRLPISSGETP